MPALSLPPPPLIPLAFAALSSLAFAALSPPQPCSSPAHRSLHDDSDEDAITGVRTYVFLANLKTVDADPLMSSLATTMSRPPQATSRCGSGPFDMVSPASTPNALSLLGHLICYIFMSMWIRETFLHSSCLID
jgi:hypothetical protein